MLVKNVPPLYLVDTEGERVIIKIFCNISENIFEKIACFVELFITLFSNRHIVK